MSMKTVPVLVWQWLRRASFVLNALLAACYQISHRTGFDLHVTSTGARTVVLGDEELVWLKQEAGCKFLEVREGVVWLTGSPAHGDVLLRSGDRLPLGKDWPLLVQALGTARVVLHS